MNKIVLLVLGLTIAWVSNNILHAETLTELLTEKREASIKKIPPPMLEVFRSAGDEVKKKNLHNKKPNVGDFFPDKEFIDKDGNKMQLSSIWKKAPLVVKFYRGHWCPYCQLELNSYQNEFLKFEKLGAKIITFTPDSNRNISKIIRRFHLQFPVISDPQNEFAKKLGLVYKLRSDLNEMYVGFGIDLKESQGNDLYELPLPATYIINKKGKVTYKFADADYTKRADPLEVINVIKCELGKDDCVRKK